MTDLQPSNEFRFRRSSSLLSYIRQFSSTEKAIFGALVIVAVITAVVMASLVNIHFMTTIPAYGGNMTEGEVGLPHEINPVLAVSDADRDISSLVYSGLTAYRTASSSDDGVIMPDIAKSWTVSPDGLTYTFTLHSNIKFQDGIPLTADDVAFTIEKIQDPILKSPRRLDWADVTVNVISPTEIQFNLKQPYAPFLSTTGVGILPKHIWQNVSDDQFIFSQFNIQPVGSGSYKISTVSRDSGGIPTEYTLSSWSGYYGAEPHLSTITFRFFADEEKALEALDAGSIDSVAAISPAEASKLASDTAEPYRIVSAPLPRVFGVFFNQSQAPVLADKIVRQALDMVIDRNAIIHTVLDGYGLPIYGPLPAGVIDTSGTSTTIAAAQTLLEKNGWKKDPNGIYEKKGTKANQILSFDIYTADTADLKQTADLVKNTWNALGADVTVKVFEPSDLYQNVIRTRKYDALLFGEQIGKDRDLYAFWHSSERNSPGLNVALYASTKADKLLEDIRTTNDDSTRASDYAQFDSLVRSDIPAVFLFVPDFIYAVPTSLHGMHLGSVITPSDRFDSIANWYTETERVWQIFAGKN